MLPISLPCIRAKSGARAAENNPEFMDADNRFARRRALLHGTVATTGLRVVTSLSTALLAFPGICATPMRAGDPARPPLRVGPGRQFLKPSQAARAARDGDIVEIDAGIYEGDVTAWDVNSLVIRAIGLVVLRAAGQAAEGKAIWVTRGENIVIEGVRFEDAKVGPRNGTGIRHEKGHLTANRCAFVENQGGLMTSNDPAARLTLNDCTFLNNSIEDGHNHSLYVGRIGHAAISGCLFRGTRTGHHVKCRAARSIVAYNLIADGATGSASYDIEFPDGGRATAIGNLVHKGRQAENTAVISYGAERLLWPDNRLEVINNTLASSLAHGTRFVFAHPETTAVLLANNILAGAGSLVLGQGGIRKEVHNISMPLSDLENVDAIDLRIRPQTMAASMRLAAAIGLDGPMPPTRQYVHPAHTVAVDIAPDRYRPGALQID